MWIGLADPMMQRGSFAFAGDVLRRALGLTEDEPLARRREKVFASVARFAPPADQRRIATFLGEIADAPFDDADDAALRAARRSPQLLATQVEEAVLAFVRAELEKGPLLVVLEDIHWADVASLRLFGTLLTRAKDQPLVVLALARPSVDDVHPKLWSTIRSQRVTLEPLLRKASEKLARAVLGD